MKRTICFLSGAMMLSINTAYASNGLVTMANGGVDLLTVAIKLVNLMALLIGIWWVMDGVMNWKKSSRDDSGGANIGFKQIIIPIISGVILASFAGFVVMTSQTFGLKGYM